MDTILFVIKAPHYHYEQDFHLFTQDNSHPLTLKPYLLINEYTANL